MKLFMCIRPHIFLLFLQDYVLLLHTIRISISTPSLELTEIKYLIVLALLVQKAPEVI